MTSDEGKVLFLILYLSIIIVGLVSYAESPKGFTEQGKYICTSIHLNASKIVSERPNYTWSVETSFAEINKNHHDVVYLFRNFSNGKVFVGYKRGNDFIVAELPYQKNLGAARSINVENNTVEACFDIPRNYTSKSDLIKMTVFITIVFVPLIILV